MPAGWQQQAADPKRDEAAAGRAGMTGLLYDLLVRRQREQRMIAGRHMHEKLEAFSTLHCSCVSSFAALCAAVATTQARARPPPRSRPQRECGMVTAAFRRLVCCHAAAPWLERQTAECT